MSRDRITYNPPRRIPTMLPEVQVRRFVSEYFRDTRSRAVRPAEALRRLVNEVYAQGVTAGQSVIEQPAERGADPNSLPPRGVDLRYQREPPVETQPGSPHFDGAEAYEAFLDAGGYHTISPPR